MRARVAALCIAVSLVAGCALKPNSIRVYAEHVSHASQHFGSNSTNFGYNALNVELHYQHGGAFLDVAEGVNLNGRSRAPWLEYGSLDGPREVFTARAGYEFALK
jgi:hypothetical protein